MAPKLALVGYGRIAPRHLEVFRARGAPVAAVCARGAEARARAAAEPGVESVYEDLAGMLDAERPDGVVACVSFDQNFKAASEVLARGIPLLLEKPPGLSPDELKALMALSRRRKAACLPGLNRRHYSVVRKAMKEIGKDLTGVSLDWSEDIDRFLKKFTRKQAALMIYANSLHGLDLLTFIGGAVPRPAVAARGKGLGCSMALQGLSTRGALSSFESHWECPGRWKLTLTAPGRRYQFAPLESCVVTERKNGAESERAIEPDQEDRDFKPGFWAQAGLFLKVVESGRIPSGWGLDSVLPAMDLAEKLTRACGLRRS